MTREFSRWEVDPFFPAAEEVQDSADRLESAYRTWTHVKSVVTEGDEDCAIQFRRRELCTALGTAKWQLEEFERAVSGLVADQRIVGEDAPGRHKQFVDAIRDQINSIEETLLESKDNRDLEALPVVKLDQVEKDDLALFLSGSRLRESDKERDVLRDFPVDQKADEEATSSSSGLMDSKCEMSHKCFASASSSDITLPKADIVKPDSMLRAREAKSSDNGLDRLNIRDKLALDFFEIRTEQSDLAVFDPASAHLLLECRIRADSDRDGNHTERVNGQRRSASVGTGLSSWKNGLVLNGTKTGERGQVENGSNVLSVWSFLKKRQHALALTISKSGFKRWKDGDANSRDLKGMSFFHKLMRQTGDEEKGNCSMWSGGGNCLTTSGSSGTVNNDDKQYKGWIDTFQSLQRSPSALPSSRPVQVASAILAALGLVGLLSFHVTATSL